MLVLQDGTKLLAPQLLEDEAIVFLLIPASAILLAAFPLLLRLIWQTHPLPAGPLRDRLEASATHAGIGMRDILVWQTNSLAVNAAVAGFFPQLRYVFLSDGLLELLDDDEIEAVLGHEMGHIHHRHLLMRIIAMLSPLGLWLLAYQAFPQWIEAFRTRFELWVDQPSIILGLIAVALVGIHAIVFFGAFSRMLEKQADLFGCRGLAEEFGDDSVGIYMRALEKLGVAAGNRTRWSWQHGSIAGRVEFLSNTAHCRKSELCFLRRIRALGSLLAALTIFPLLYLLLIG
jgi:STE24 endopeptidase